MFKCHNIKLKHVSLVCDQVLEGCVKVVGSLIVGDIGGWKDSVEIAIGGQRRGNSR